MDMRYDTSRPLGVYWALQVNGFDEAYGISYATGGNARAGGLAVGYQNITSFPLAYSLTVGGGGINSDDGYYAGGTTGVSCTSQNVTSVNGIVTACGGGRTPSTNLVTFQALAKASTATVVAGGTGYAVNDTITLTGGTCSTYPVLTVATVSVTAVATVTVSTIGSCTVLPSAPTAQGSSSGAGTGATFQVTWAAIAQTYTPTSGISTVDVYACGPGGSGGGGALQAASTVASGASGGGGGSCIPATLTAAQIGASQNVTVGLPGIQGAPATSNSTAGGNAGTAIATNFGTLVSGIIGGAGEGGQLAAVSVGGGGAGYTSGIAGASGGGAGTICGAAGGSGAGGGSPNCPNGGAGGGGGGGGGAAWNGGSSAAGAGGASGGGLTSASATAAGGNGGAEYAAGRAITAAAGGAANT